MRFFFIVQGEGRGHMTQSIALADLLEQNGHAVVRVVVGKSERRELPSFLTDRFGELIHQVESPNFVTDKHNKTVRILPTLFFVARRMPRYINSLGIIHRWIKADEPDVIINFYDFIGGFLSRFKKPRARFVCIAHQYLLGHHHFPFPKGRLFERRSLLLANYLSSMGAEVCLALSFSDYPEPHPKKLVVVPPLLRKEIRQLPITCQDHFLVYILNDGYAEDVEAFHKKFPNVPLHCFWDRKGVPARLQVDEHLTFHQLDGQKFLSYMASCKGYLTTAGFESVCEAMYLGKPVLMIPVHFEQDCNALDAVRAGAGIFHETFDLEQLLNYLPAHRPVQEDFVNWWKQGESLLLKHLTEP